jgi:hypothetical protein
MLGGPMTSLGPAYFKIQSYLDPSVARSNYFGSALSMTQARSSNYSFYSLIHSCSPSICQSSIDDSAINQ